MKHNLGLCCISETLRDQNPEFKFKTMTSAAFSKMPRNEAIAELASRIYHNILVTKETIKHCEKIGIFHYRLSSALFPLITKTDLNLLPESLPNYAQIIDLMGETGVEVQRLGVRTSIHPDQFNVLGSDNPDVREKTIKELDFQGWILDSFGFPQSYECPMNIHPAFSGFENVEVFMNNFFSAFSRCSNSVKSRICIENEDSGFWTAANTYEYFYLYCRNKFGFSFPLTFDNAHDAANPSKKENGETFSMNHWILKYIQTWGVTPVFHWSKIEPGTRNSHAAKIDELPPFLGTDIVWEVEVKDKEKGFLHLINSQNSA